MFGLKWLLNIIEQVRVKEDKSGFFKFLRSSYSILKVSCLKNKGGRFLEIVDYHSGAQRGSIRIPEGAKSAGWKKITSEIWSFFLGREDKTDPPMLIPAGSGHGRGAKSEYGKPGALGSSRDSRKRNNLIAPIKPLAVTSDSYEGSNSQVVLDLEAPRPTRKSTFMWNPTKNTLRITKIQGEACQAHWVTIKHKVVGLAQIQQKLKAHSVEDTDIDPCLVDPIKQNVEVNASTLGTKDSIPVAMEMILHSAEPRTTDGVSIEPILTQVISDPPTLTTEASELPSLTIDDNLSEEEEVSEVPQTTAVVELGFSKVVRVDLAESESARELKMAVAHSLPQSPDTDRQVVEVSEVREVEAQFPAVEYCFEDRDGSSPLYCSPLAVVLPATCSNSVVVSEVSPEEFSQWVKTHYKDFCKLVGFPIGSHEQQCLDLLQRIEADRFKYTTTNKRKKPAGSIKKGSRELHNLVSSINYDGRLLGC